jgi:3-dehydroquinate synthase II
MDDRVAIAPEAADPAAELAIVERARRRGFRRFVVRPGSTAAADGAEERVVFDGEALHLPGVDRPVAVRSVHELPQLEELLAAAPDNSVLAIAWSGDRVIPLEWAVARRGRRFRLWTFARAPDEVPAALGALEHGADRVVVRIGTPEEVDRLEGLLDRPVAADLSWVSVPLRAVRPAGLGDRVIVDTTSLLRAEEGLLVGSAAAFLFHVASEAVGSKFSRPRPFRVNAGAAHSYVLMADGTTRYLSELGPGDAVLAAVPSGATRSVRVGRIKIERRPLSVVVADDAGTERTVFLQEAETVRLSGEHGRRALTEVRSGETVRGVRLPAARHLGAAIEETIEER